ncbi:hypothetical protein SDJN03_11493, partial [Cucurbita argyrosperma subsp. sororia]
MEKEEEPKFSSFPNLELDSHGVLSRNEKSVSDGTDEAKSAKSGCHSLENAAPQNQRYTTFVPRALNQQHARERSSPLPVSSAVNDRLHPPQNLANLQSPLSQPQQFLFSLQPFWVQPHPSIAQPQCYPVGYPTYPGFPGSWDASTWGAQTQPLLFPGMSNYSRASYGFVSSQFWSMPAPNCITSSSVQPLSRGVIKPPEKLSKTHQRLWGAQSAENVQMWNMIGQLQGELGECKGRLIKLEAEISSFRSATATDEAAVGVGNGGIMVKRRRSKRAAAPVCSQHSLQPRTRIRKPRMGRTKPNVLEKESLNKVDDKQQSTPMEMLADEEQQGGA